MDKEETVFMIKPDGSLWKGSSVLMPELLKQGWRQILNPKRNYYPEYDQSHSAYKKEIVISDEGNEEVLSVIEV